MYKTHREKENDFMDYSQLTYITLSRERLKEERIVPHGSKWINHVSRFFNMEDGLQEYLNAIGKVETDYFVFWDDDDTIPIVNLLPIDSGLVYNDVHVRDNGREVIKRPTRYWNRVDHLSNPFLLHRAVCNTKYVKEIQSVLPRVGAQFEYLYHYLLADNYGCIHDPGFISIWDRREVGMHNLARGVMESTTAFIKEHRDSIKDKLHK